MYVVEICHGLNGISYLCIFLYMSDKSENYSKVKSCVSDYYCVVMSSDGEVGDTQKFSEPQITEGTVGGRCFEGGENNCSSLPLEPVAGTQSKTTMPSPTFTVDEEVTTVHIPMFRPKPPFLDILKESGAKREVFTMKEIVHHVKNYIIAHQLFDSINPRVVHCGGNKLGKVLQVSKFTDSDAIHLFLRNSTPVPDTYVRIRRQLVTRAVKDSSAYDHHPGSQKEFKDLENEQPSSSSDAPGASLLTTDLSMTSAQPEDTPSSSIQTSLKSDWQEMRTTDEDVAAKRMRYTSVNVSYGDDLDEVDGTPPFCVQVKLETKEDENKPERGSSQAPDVEEDSISVQYDSDHFALEYEISSSDPKSESDISSHDSAKDIVVVCQESDVEFWADYSDTDGSTDVELSDLDLWECEACQTKNIPLYRNCSKCWKLRPGWLPEISSSLPVGNSSPLSKRLQKGRGMLGVEANSSESTDDKLASGRQRLNLVTERARKRTVRIMSASSSGRTSDSLASDEEVPGTSSTFAKHSSKGLNTGSSNLPILSQQEMDEGDAKSTNKQDIEKSQVSCIQPIPAYTVQQKRPSVARGKWHRGLGVNWDVVASASDVCVVCASRPKTGSIIHGSSGHQVCCYRCAKRLKHKSLPCPVCRRPIQKVVKNFIL